MQINISNIRRIINNIKKDIENQFFLIFFLLFALLVIPLCVFKELTYASQTRCQTNNSLVISSLFMRLMPFFSVLSTIAPSVFVSLTYALRPFLRPPSRVRWLQYQTRTHGGPRLSRILSRPLDYCYVRYLRSFRVWMMRAYFRRIRHFSTRFWTSSVSKIVIKNKRCLGNKISHLNVLCLRYVFAKHQNIIPRLG